MNKKKADRSIIRDTSITVQLNRAEKQRIEKAAQRRGITNSTFIRMLINDYLEERGK